MPKFFVENHQVIEEKTIHILNEDVKHIKNVLRLKLGDMIQVCSFETRKNYLCEIKCIEDDKIECEVKNILESEAEPKNKIDVYQALPKQEKMEWILQKGAELGMENLIPVVTSRCVVKLDEKDAAKKIARWQKIVESAAKQSGRDMIPKVENLNTLKMVSEKIKEYDVFLLAYENEKTNTLKQELKNLSKEENRIAILIGPEGGLEEEEVLSLKENGAKVITLGKRILRTETASMHMISNILYELEG